MERDLFQQQDLLAASQGRVSQNLVLLYKALGGGWINDLNQDDPSLENISMEKPQQQQCYSSIGGWNNLPDQTTSQDTNHAEEQQ